MVEEQKARVEDAMQKMVEEVDKSYLRVLQGKMFKCGATCCEDKTSSMQSVQRCIENCSRPLNNAQHYIKNEFDHFQDRLQRCIMTCNDSIRDKMGPDVKESDVAKYTGEFEKCTKKCVDDHIKIIPDLLKRIKEVMKKELN